MGFERDDSFNELRGISAPAASHTLQEPHPISKAFSSLLAKITGKETNGAIAPAAPVEEDLPGSMVNASAIRQNLQQQSTAAVIKPLVRTTTQGAPRATDTLALNIESASSVSSSANGQTLESYSLDAKNPVLDLRNVQSGLVMIRANPDLANTLEKGIEVVKSSPNQPKALYAIVPEMERIFDTNNAMTKNDIKDSRALDSSVDVIRQAMQQSQVSMAEHSDMTTDKVASVPNQAAPSAQFELS